MLYHQQAVIYAPMTGPQRMFYQAAESGAMRGLVEQCRFTGAGTKKISDQNPQMNCRKVCNHPFLFGEPSDPFTGEPVGITNPNMLIASCGKFLLLLC